MSEITKEQDDPDHIIGGQIWYINKKINIDKIRNLLNIVGKLSKQISDESRKMINSAHMTAIRNESVSQHDDTNIIQIFMKNYNNNEEEIKQWINDIAEINKPPKDDVIEEWAIKLLDTLRYCSTECKAIYLKRSQHFNKDQAIKSINKMIQYLANSKMLQNKWDKELEKYKLLPNHPMEKENFILFDAEITTKEGDVIYYNAYTACQHWRNPCNDCLLSGTRNLRERKRFIMNLFCR